MESRQDNTSIIVMKRVSSQLLLLLLHYYYLGMQNRTGPVPHDSLSPPVIDAGHKKINYNSTPQNGTLARHTTNAYILRMEKKYISKSLYNSTTMNNVCSWIPINCIKISNQ